ncbi:hypothetical protein FGSG_13395 [Fusarium graminearum PH-1]|uniref:Chromosome 2, complete genome n=1 Tax=Gibberella zeae (strain ATCC MYA-4620 / CBS 123657 / FGSC 9075 / NRRL 31084 / PH-1) TaxID=229533 RepID=I1S965_GIBZE|nr:hypothetical protein FGSG_13395 [Fusarium graminearum PH-1]ESU15062.1 hypothetical protein FGSG_13395 [Fusarium graminearum PH-1]CAF3487154.1 unnamed protein product [Fusarium graminearum]CEF76608.1 unnamed protein product [Fusarium graminearum]|eukprot:XP_011320487.1 hypothetical protein FGSG_13395 [Fusarium graminearum PH-1]
MAFYLDDRTEVYLCPEDRGRDTDQSSRTSPWIGLVEVGVGTGKQGVDKNSWSRRMELQSRNSVYQPDLVLIARGDTKFGRAWLGDPDFGPTRPGPCVDVQTRA